MWGKSFVKQTSMQSHCGKSAKACSLVLNSSPTPSWLFTISSIIVKEQCTLWAPTCTVEKTTSLQIKWLCESIYNNVTKCLMLLVIRNFSWHLLHWRLEFPFCCSKEIATFGFSLLLLFKGRVVKIVFSMSYRIIWMNTAQTAPQCAHQQHMPLTQFTTQCDFT